MTDGVPMTDGLPMNPKPQEKWNPQTQPSPPGRSWVKKIPPQDSYRGRKFLLVRPSTIPVRLVDVYSSLTTSLLSNTDRVSAVLASISGIDDDGLFRIFVGNIIRAFMASTFLYLRHEQRVIASSGDVDNHVC